MSTKACDKRSDFCRASGKALSDVSKKSDLKLSTSVATEMKKVADGLDAAKSKDERRKAHSKMVKTMSILGNQLATLPMMRGNSRARR